MVSKCGRCGAEARDGAVFCESCGERFVVGVPDGYHDDAPFFAYQFMGRTSLLTAGGWTIRYVIPQLFAVVVFALFAASIGWAGMPILVLIMEFVLVYGFVWLILLLRYRAKGRPMDFGGSGPPVNPPAAASTSIESDFPGPIASMGPEDSDGTDRSHSLTPKRR